MDLELPVTLVVKAPNQKVGDQTIECGLGWTIKKLKEHISKVYPSKPREHQQKLIYSGRLLNDHLMLKDVLRQYDDDIKTHTVHLVCAPSPNELSQSSYQQPAQKDQAGSSSSSASSSHEGSPTSSPPASPPDPAEGLRHRHTGSVDTAPLPTTTATTTPQPAPDAFQNMYGANMMYGGNFYPGVMAPGMMPYSPEQMMWLQQMYAQQMAQYMQLYQGAMPPTPPASPGPVPPQQDMAANPNAPPANAAPNQRAAGGDQPIRMNAQGGMVMDDDDDMNRDWLDWMYTLSRVAVLLSIVYFYSTFGRFVLVLSLFVAAYLYQGGWFRIQRREQRDPQRQDQMQEQQQQQQQILQQQEQLLLLQQQELEQQQQQQAADGHQAQDQTSDEEDSVGAEDSASGEPAEPPPPGPLAVAWSFFYTFFSSLIPQQPAAVNAN